MRRRKQSKSASPTHTSTAASPAQRGHPPARAADTAGRVGNADVEQLVDRSRRQSAGDAAQRQAATDPAADAAAHLLEAEAATVEGHIVQRRSAPTASSEAGRQLLSHELTHLFQQRAASKLLPEVGRHDSPLEAGANAPPGATARGDARTGAVPAVQRKPKPGAEQAADVVPKRLAVVEQRLLAYLQRVLAEQKGRALQMTDAVRGDLRRLATGDVNTLMRLDAFLGVSGPRDPASLAAALTKLLPDTFDARKSAFLDELPADAAPSSMMDRAIDLVEKTSPYVSPDAQQAQWEFDRRAKEARRNDDVVGPYGLDLQRAFNIGLGLSDVVSPKKKKPVPKPLAATTETLVGSLDEAELIPKAARGTNATGGYAVASDVARDVARRLAEAQKKRGGSIALRLGANYKVAEDRFEILDALERIVRRTAETLADGGEPVQTVEVFFGNLLVRRISVRGDRP